MDFLKITDLFVAFFSNVQDVTEVCVFCVLSPSFSDRVDQVCHQMLLCWQQSVHKDSLRLMCPQSTNIFRMDLVLIRSTNTHYKLPKVPQVEDIVYFSWSWQQLFQAFIVQLNTILEHCWDLLLFCVVVERNSQDGSEDAGEGVLIEVCNGDDV